MPLFTKTIEMPSLIINDGIAFYTRLLYVLLLVVIVVVVHAPELILRSLSQFKSKRTKRFIY